MAHRAELHVRHRIHVTFVIDQIRPEPQGMQADGAVMAAGQEETLVGTEAGAVDGAGVWTDNGLFFGAKRGLIKYPLHDVLGLRIEFLQLMGRFHGAQTFLRDRVDAKLGVGVAGHQE